MTTLYDLTALGYNTADGALWREWMTANGIPLKDTARGTVEITDDGQILVPQFLTGVDGERVIHACCSDGHAHIARRTGIYPLVVAPVAGLDAWRVQV